MKKNTENGTSNVAVQINARVIGQVNNGSTNVFTIVGANGQIVVPESKAEKTAKDSPMNHCDTASIRPEILDYVSRVRTLLTEDAKSSFMKMWDDILDLPEVESKVYNPGHQYGTNFNRDLVANILYHLRARKIYSKVYKDNINSAALAQALENNKEHPVKHALRAEPPEDVCQAIDAMLKKKY